MWTMPSSCGSVRSANSAKPAIASTSSSRPAIASHGARCRAAAAACDRAVDGPPSRGAAWPAKPRLEDRMTLTRDRQVGAARRRPACSTASTPTGMDRIARGRRRGRVPGRSRHRPAGRDRDRASSSSSSGGGPGRPRRRDARRRSARATSSGSCRSSTGSRAIAQVVAVGPTTCLALASWDFEAVLLEEPRVALAILRGLAGAAARPDRSRTTTDRTTADRR